MKVRNSTFVIALFISIAHFILGNLIGGSWEISSNFIDFIFLPYSFIAGLSNFAGWDSLSIILEVFGFIFMTFIFYLVVKVIQKLTKRTNKVED